MATLYVTEYATGGFAQVGGAVVQTPHEPPLARQTVSIGASSAASSAFNMQTTLIRLHTDVICSFGFGFSPVATTSFERMAANQTEFHTVQKGQGYQVAVIANT